VVDSQGHGVFFFFPGRASWFFFLRLDSGLRSEFETPPPPFFLWGGGFFFFFFFLVHLLIFLPFRRLVRAPRGVCSLFHARVSRVFFRFCLVTISVFFFFFRSSYPVCFAKGRFLLGHAGSPRLFFSYVLFPPPAREGFKGVFLMKLLSTMMAVFFVCFSPFAASPLFWTGRPLLKGSRPDSSLCGFFPFPLFRTPARTLADISAFLPMAYSIWVFFFLAPSYVLFPLPCFFPPV